MPTLILTLNLAVNSGAGKLTEKNTKFSFGYSNISQVFRMASLVRVSLEFNRR